MGQRRALCVIIAIALGDKVTSKVQLETRVIQILAFGQFVCNQFGRAREQYEPNKRQLETSNLIDCHSLVFAYVVGAQFVAETICEERARIPPI